MKISGHRLLTANPARAIDFYQRKLGMSLISQQTFEGKNYYFLSFGSEEDADLILIEDTSNPPSSIAEQPSQTEGYWKCSLSVPDVELVRNRLIETKVSIGQSFEVPDVAYLCHLKDADGYCIELVQHKLGANHQPYKPDDKYILGCRPSINLSTLRVRDIEASLTFYESLGLKLVSRQRIPARGMTLYFLSTGQEEPPTDDIDALGIREWLWQRPYTILELQHIHGTENSPSFSYRTGAETGFLGLDMSLGSNTPALIKKEATQECFVSVNGVLSGFKLIDPDGYSIRLSSQ